MDSSEAKLDLFLKQKLQKYLVATYCYLHFSHKKFPCFLISAFKESNVGGKPPGMWKTLLGVLSSRQSISSPENFRGYHLLWTGLGAQLARDVPFSAICWTVLEPTRRHLTGLVGDKSNAAVILGANFSAGFIAGVISAGATCPLDVAKTRRQIEKDPERLLNMNTRRILLEVWRYSSNLLF